MSAGVMPRFACPGEMMPGQFGPIRRTPAASARSTTIVESWTGMPSVMRTIVSMPASMASRAAPFAKAGGTKMTDAFAPVASRASATVPKTGTSTWPSVTLSAPGP